MELVLIFISGLIFGSFFNVLGIRIPVGKAFLYERSVCPSCQETLKFYHLIPVLSYLLQGGRCSFCRERISFIYPFIECTTAVLFTYSFIQYGYGLEFFMTIFLISLLMIIFVSDIFYLLIPNKILGFFLLLFIVMRTIYPFPTWWDSLLGAIVGFSLIAVIILLSQGGMGAGDMKLFGLLGFVLGWKYVLVTFALAVMIGGGYSIWILLVNKERENTMLPFGPFIVVACLLTFFQGNYFIQFYLKLFYS